MIKKFELYNESLKDKMKGKSENDILNNAFNILKQYNTLSFEKDFQTIDNYRWTGHKMKGWLEERFDKYSEGYGIYLLIMPSNTKIDKIPFKNVYKHKSFEYNNHSSFIKYDIPKKYFKFFLKQLIIKTLSGEYNNFHIKIVGNYLDNVNESLKDKMKGKSKNQIEHSLDNLSNDEKIRKILRYKLPIDLPKNNMYSLYIAIRYGYLDIAENLLKQDYFIKNIDEEFVDNILIKVIGNSDDSVRFIIEHPIMKKYIDPEYIKELEEYLNEDIDSLDESLKDKIFEEWDWDDYGDRYGYYGRPQYGYGRDFDPRFNDLFDDLYRKYGRLFLELLDKMGEGRFIHAFMDIGPKLFDQYAKSKGYRKSYDDRGYGSPYIYDEDSEMIDVWEYDDTRFFIHYTLNDFRKLMNKGKIDIFRHYKKLLNYCIKNDIYDIFKKIIDNKSISLSYNDYEIMEDVIKYNRMNMFNDLLKDHRINLRTGTNKFLRLCIYYKSFEMFNILLNDERIEPSAFGNDVLLYACNDGNIKYINAMLSNDRVDPSAGQNRVLYDVLNEYRYQLAEILMKDKRVLSHVNISFVYNNGHKDFLKSFFNKYPNLVNNVNMDDKIKRDLIPIYKSKKINRTLD